MALRPLLYLSLAALCVFCVRVGTEAAAQTGQTHSTQTHAAHAGGMQPGQYHTTVTFTNVRGLPPAMAQGMMAHPHTSDGCLATSDINAVVQDSIAASANMTCTEDHGSASGGVISGRARCRDDDGNSGALTLAGAYTATHADVSADLSAQTQMGPVSEHIHLVSDRTGACR